MVLWVAYACVVMAQTLVLNIQRFNNLDLELVMPKNGE
jgi:hypothetical protein